MSRTAPKSILVVDDDPGVLSLLTAILSSAGYRVLEASDGKQAVARFREDPTDLVITDLIMPEQEGYQTITTLLHEHPRLKTIVISGAAKGKYLKIAAAVGAHAILQKPFRKQELLDTVRKLLS